MNQEDAQDMNNINYFTESETESEFDYDLGIKPRADDPHDIQIEHDSEGEEEYYRLVEEERMKIVASPDLSDSEDCDADDQEVANYLEQVKRKPEVIDLTEDEPVVKVSKKSHNHLFAVAYACHVCKEYKPETTKHNECRYCTVIVCQDCRYNMFVSGQWDQDQKPCPNCDEQYYYSFD